MGIGQVVGIINNKLQNICINLNTKYPRLNLEVNDYPRLQRAILDIPLGSNLLIPNMELDLNGNDIVIDRSINIIGEKKPFFDYITTNLFLYGSVFKNGGIIIESDSVEIKKIGIHCPTLDNGFQGNTASARDVKIIDCITVSRDHGYLFESYNGLVDVININDCQSYNSIHGFISKAHNVSFNNCLAINHVGGYGFGFISDNIPLATKIGESRWNSAVNCRTSGCDYGFMTYSRDYYSEDNTNNVRMSELTLTNCFANECKYVGFRFGDIDATPTGKTYNKCFAVLALNCVQTGGNPYASFEIGRLKDSNLIMVSAEKPFSYHSELSENVRIHDIASYLTSLGTVDDIAILETGIAPNLNITNDNIIVKTNNTINTSLADIVTRFKRVTVTIMIDEDYTTIPRNSSFVLSRASYSGKGSYVVLKHNGTNWTEIYGYQVSKGTVQKQIDLDNLALDLTKGSTFDITAFGNNTVTANTISFSGKNPDSEIITIIVRSCDGTLTYGGFNSATIIAPTGFPTTLAWNEAHVTQWLYLNTVNKWICVSSMVTVPYN